MISAKRGMRSEWRHNIYCAKLVGACARTVVAHGYTAPKPYYIVHKLIRIT